MNIIKKLSVLVLSLGLMFNVGYGYILSSDLKSKIEDVVHTMEQKFIKGVYTKREKVVTMLNEYKTTGGQKKIAIVDTILEAIVPSFDSCGGYTTYSRYDRFDTLESKLFALGYIVYTSAEFMEGCLSLDGKHFIMIEKDNGMQNGSLINFNTITQEIRLVGGWFTSIGTRNGAYVEIEQFDLGDLRYAGRNTFYSKYYYMDNVLVKEKRCMNDQTGEKNCELINKVELLVKP